MKKTLYPSFKGFIDTTLRDGQQSPLMFDSRKYRFSLEDKKSLVSAMIALGIRHFEFFSPVVSESEKRDAIALIDFIKLNMKEKVIILAHVRCHPSDIAEAIRLGFDGLNMYMGIAERAQKYSHGYTFSDILELVTKTITQVRREQPNLYIRFSVEDCFRTPLTDVYKIYDQISSLVNTFGMPDTVGVATPQVVAHHVKALKKRYPKVDLECHFHNDRGLSVINALTAIQSGASYIDTSVWGMAERSGITSLTAILLNIAHETPHIQNRYQLDYCYPLNVLMGSILKLQVPYNEPVSLTNRTHTAGVHQKAVLNNGSLYEAHDLQTFGVTKNQLLLGPLSGWNLIYYYLREIDYYDVTPEQAKDIAKNFKKQADRISKKSRPETVLAQIVAQYKLLKLPVKEQFLGNRIENLS